MSDMQGGRVVWHLDADDSEFNRKIVAGRAKASALGADLENTGNRAKAAFTGNLSAALGSIQSFSAGAASSFNNVSQSIERASVPVLRFSAVVGTVAAGALALASKASLDMVSSVQKSTIALSAYTGSAQVASAITKELIDFARSPRGVLFNRDELLATATRLRGAGLETEKLTGFVKAMAPAVAASTSNYRELGEIMAQIIGTGKLLEQDYRQLAQRGVVLDRSLVGQAISADKLREALEKAIPTSILDKQAQTIEGIKIRLKTAFRELGNAFLDVQYGADEMGASFAPGSPGDVASKGVQRLTQILRSPANVRAIQDFGKAVADFAIRAVPLIERGFRFILNHWQDIAFGIGAIASAWVTAKAAFVGFTVIEGAAGALRVLSEAVTLLAGGKGLAALGALGAVMGPIAVGVSALVGGVVFLLAKLGVLDDVVRFVKDAFVTFWTTIKPVFQSGWALLKTIFEGIRDGFNRVWPDIQRAWGELARVYNSDLKPALEQARVNFDKLVESLRPLMPYIKEAAVNFGIVLGVALIGTLKVLTLLIQAFAWFVEKVTPIINFVAPILKDVFQGIAEGMKLAHQAILSVASGILAALHIVAQAIDTIIPGPPKIAPKVAAMREAINAELDKTKQDAGQKAIDTTAAIASGLSGAPEAAGAAVAGVPQSVAEGMAGAPGAAAGAGASAELAARGSFGKVPGAASSAVAPTGAAVAGALSNLSSVGEGSGRGLASSLADGIRRGAGLAIGAAEWLAKQIRDRLPGSDAKVGPLSDLTHSGYMLPVTLAKGITQGAGTLVGTVGRMLGSMTGSPDGLSVSPDVSGGFAGVTGASGDGSPVHIHADFSGIVARSRSEWREIMKDGVRAIDEELRARDKTPIMPAGA